MSKKGKERSAEDQARYDKLGEDLALNSLGWARLVVKCRVSPIEILDGIRLAELEAYINYRKRKEE